MLGEVDDLIIERILDTEASLEEVVEALHDIEDERELDEVPGTPTTPEVAEVRVILREVFAEADADEGEEEADTLPIIEVLEDRPD